MKKILTIAGGFSTEREISIKTGRAVAKGIKNAGYDSIFVDTAFPEIIIEVDKDFTYELNSHRVARTLEKDNALIETIKSIAPEKVFIGLHGGEGENGEIQKMLDSIGVEYVGSGSISSAICMDKNESKIFAKKVNVPLAKWKMLADDEKRSEKVKELINKDYSYPVVIKALAQGSSIGVSILHSEEDIDPTIAMMNNINDEFMIEEYISGRELSIPVIHNKAFPVIELIPNEGFYDYEHKYNEGVTQHVCPAELTEKQVETINSYALKMNKVLGCKDYSRIDFILDKEGEFFFLEANTLPGMTELSLVPECARNVGYNFPDLMRLLIEE
ncbi:MAG: D-alanine--D-alanine ligase [Candidatus Delongbacteria bacterium]|nr:D-alanine--D-alanine ligase [Candidatus Delongbacteria bacterium]